MAYKALEREHRWADYFYIARIRPIFSQQPSMGMGNLVLLFDYYEEATTKRGITHASAAACQEEFNSARGRANRWAPLNL